MKLYVLWVGHPCEKRIYGIFHDPVIAQLALVETQKVYPEEPCNVEHTMLQLTYKTARLIWTSIVDIITGETVKLERTYDFGENHIGFPTSEAIAEMLRVEGLFPINVEYVSAVSDEHARVGAIALRTQLLALVGSVDNLERDTSDFFYAIIKDQSKVLRNAPPA